MIIIDIVVEYDKVMLSLYHSCPCGSIPPIGLLDSPSLLFVHGGHIGKRLFLLTIIIPAIFRMRSSKCKNYTDVIVKL